MIGWRIARKAVHPMIQHSRSRKNRTHLRSRLRTVTATMMGDTAGDVSLLGRVYSGRVINTTG